MKRALVWLYARLLGWFAHHVVFQGVLWAGVLILPFTLVPIFPLPMLGL